MPMGASSTPESRSGLAKPQAISAPARPTRMGLGRAPQSSPETSAVTGACLAVERRKLEAVGGFDLEHLPIELNDVDLCLRLGERGWKSVCLSQISLFHEESASRGGAKFRLLKVHAKERKYFVDCSRLIIRDDPYFHPAFSLFRRQQALG